MMINGVLFVEDSVNKSPSAQYAPENRTNTRRLYLPHDNDPDAIDRAAVALLGGTDLDSELVGGVRRAYLKRQTPHAYPPASTIDNLLAEDFEYATSIPLVEPSGAPSGVEADGRTKYSWNRFHVRYECPAHNVKEDDEVLATGDYDATLFVSPLAQSLLHGAPARPDEGDALRRGWSLSRWIVKSVKRASRTVSLPQGFVKWQTLAEHPTPGGRPEPVGQGLPYTQARANVDYHWLCVPVEAVPEALIQLALNRVNQFTFDRWPVGTLLLVDYDLRQYRSATGRRVADVSYHCIFLPNYDVVTATFNGWNSALRVVGGKVRCWPISGDGGTINPLAIPAAAHNQVFKFVDFANLFRPPWPFA